MSSSGSRTASSVLHAAVITFACATSMRAQSLPQLRDGFTGSAGVGVGVASVRCSMCASGAGGAAYVRLGGALRPDLILAGEVSTVLRSGNMLSESQYEVQVQLSTVSMVAQWYPRVERGFFVEGGVGVGSLEASIKDRVAGFSHPSSVSAGYQLGVGYDYRLKRNLSVTPYATLFGVAPAHMVGTSETVHGNALQIGLGLTQH